MKKRNRVLALTMAAAMSASLLAGCGSSTQQDGAAASSEASASTTAAADGEEDNIIRVGVVCSMTGGSAIYGEGAQNAIDMAVEEINGGDSGYKIEIVNGGKVADDAKDAKQAMNAYNKVMADSPEAIVGSFFSSVTLPMAEQASKDGMLLLATGATNADVTLKGDTIFRKECACFMTADIGAYNTCGHLCRYCYANYSKELVTQNMRQHDPQSPFLIGHSLPGDVIHQAQQESWVENQLSLFDLL